MTLTDPGRPCSVCRGRLDAVASAIGRHPGCGAYRQVSDDALDLLVAHLAKDLGAVEMETNKGDAMTDKAQPNRKDTTDE